MSLPLSILNSVRYKNGPQRQLSYIPWFITKTQCCTAHKHRDLKGFQTFKTLLTATCAQCTLGRLSCGSRLLKAANLLRKIKFSFVDFACMGKFVCDTRSIYFTQKYAAEQTVSSCSIFKSIRVLSQRKFSFRLLNDLSNRNNKYFKKMYAIKTWQWVITKSALTSV